MSGPHPDPKRNSTLSMYQNRKKEFEKESGRETRARTRLIAEGFSNLALIATFFAGVQAQLISVTNSPGSAPAGPVSIATNAAFYGGLIFSVFTAVLATLSARWFSILREDDADYLSSRWLCVDSKMENESLLREYLDYQIDHFEKIAKGEPQGTEHTSHPSDPEKSPMEVSPMGQAAPMTQASQGTQANQDNQAKDFNPTLSDARCLVQLLKQERYGVATPPEDIEAARKIPMSESTIREQILSFVLISPLIACLPSFGLFTTGILLLAWDTQPKPVAIFSSAVVFVCVVPLSGFFLRHRHKLVVRHIYLGRPSL